jgi:hypothetical protein
MNITPSVLHDLRAAERGIGNLNALESAEQIEALAMALTFVIRAVRTACEQDQTYAADRLRDGRERDDVGPPDVRGGPWRTAPRTSRGDSA